MRTPKKRFENRRSGGQRMSSTKTIYVFRCGETGLYAFTADPKGHILPSQIYPRVRWRFHRSLTLRSDRNSPKGKMVKATLVAIAKHGFHLTHIAANAELSAFTAQHYERIDPQKDVLMPSDSPRHPKECSSEY
jgi:hypothetical protein